MKVAIDLKLMAQSQTGISAFIQTLLDDIQNAHYTDMDIFLLYPKGAARNKQVFNKMKYIDVEPSHFKNSMVNHLLYDQYSILKALNKLKPDVFYVPYFDIPYFYNGKLITSIHDMTLYNHRHFYPKKQQLYYGMLIQRAIKRSKFIITISNASKEEICETFSYPRDNVFVWYIKLKEGFVAKSRGDVDLKQIRKKYSLPEHFILYTGGVDPRKNIDRLIRSYKIMKSLNVHSPSLVITGSSNKYSSRLLQDLGVKKEKDTVVLPGYIDECDLPAVYSLSLFTVYPSANEGFGIPLVESMASGKAVCCPDIELFREIAGNVPLFYERSNDEALTEAMLHLSSDSILRQQKEKEGLERAEIYKNINHAQEFENLLRQAVIA